MPPANSERAAAAEQPSRHLVQQARYRDGHTRARRQGARITKRGGPVIAGLQTVDENHLPAESLQENRAAYTDDTGTDDHHPIALITHLEHQLPCASSAMISGSVRARGAPKGTLIS